MMRRLMRRALDPRQRRPTRAARHFAAIQPEALMKILIAVDGSACKFDGVMMGPRGHGDIANLVLGSVVTKVLAECSIPVLLVR